ncbi:putative hydrolase of the HAD superfamily [Ferrimonas sediminum]|uniref:Putative hydrolase of the HAD superfamily n=1 Tax=Ferrimonas sediminum TaxID=718193 RepID=A0A1G8XHH8_9GAMM|nr:pyrimidine 5'-nucleotidase [Ferrimonas sediminum]SDJ90059.1 putative hydrolase of the HAD superfamily [Ferrimonas sediminum]
MNYDWILFDADDTLFHFDDFAGLKLLFSQRGCDFDRQHYLEYQQRNRPLWVAYQNGEIGARELQRIRFEPWTGRLALSAAEINAAFLKAMAEVCQPLPGARTLLTALHRQAQLGIITNGFTDLQQARLKNTNLEGLFSLLVISEQVGVAKPDPRIFDHAKSLMENSPAQRVLMVGDNPHSDILGGQRAGFDTCWLNQHDRPCPDGIVPDFQVRSLPELQALLLA